MHQWRNKFTENASIYPVFKKRQALLGELTWSHYSELIYILGDNEINYYQYISVVQNLSVRELYERIKNNKYERISKIGELEG